MARKNYSHFLLVLLMLSAQFALAHHATVHFTAHSHVSAHANDEPADHKPAAHEQCQICVLSKSFAHALAAVGYELAAPSSALTFAVPGADRLSRQKTANAYLARAPPSFLS